MNRTALDTDEATRLIMEACEALRRQIGAQVTLRVQAADPPKGLPTLGIRPKGGRKDHVYDVELIPVLTQVDLVRLLNAPQELLGKLLITRYLKEKWGDQLRAAGIQFLDTAGNTYIASQGNLLVIGGREPPADWALHARPKTATAFTPAGLKVQFVLLARPEYLNRPYRDIARAAGVALGTVGGVMERLKEMGYLINRGADGADLSARPRLIEEWVGAYILRLAHRYKERRFHADDRDWWTKVDLKPFGACWGGDVAAFRLTGYLKPAEITIYTRAGIAPILQNFRMRADPKGEIRIVEPFWDFPATEGEEDTAPPLLVYADLMATGDPRAIETARKIQEKYLA